MSIFAFAIAVILFMASEATDEAVDKREEYCKEGSGGNTGYCKVIIHVGLRVCVFTLAY